MLSAHSRWWGFEERNYGHQTCDLFNGALALSLKSKHVIDNFNIRVIIRTEHALKL